VPDARTAEQVRGRARLDSPSGRSCPDRLVGRVGLKLNMLWSGLLSGQAQRLADRVLALFTPDWFELENDT
jgi:hypothetical protein